jgi:hypothetical protein
MNKIKINFSPLSYSNTSDKHVSNFNYFGYVRVKSDKYNGIVYRPLKPEEVKGLIINVSDIPKYILDWESPIGNKYIFDEDRVPSKYNIKYAEIIAEEIKDKIIDKLIDGIEIEQSDSIYMVREV